MLKLFSATFFNLATLYIEARVAIATFYFTCQTFYIDCKNNANEKKVKSL